jgi:hypothetical protein
MSTSRAAVAPFARVIPLTIARAGLRYVLHLHDYDYIEDYRSREHVA